MDMKKDPPHISDLDSKTLFYIKIFFLVAAILGSGLFYFFQRSTVGGLGIATCLFSLVSFFHFNKPRAGKTKHIDTKMTWFLLALTLLGIVIIIVNEMQGGPDFYRGIGAGLSLICGITYALELLMVWLDNVR